MTNGAVKGNVKSSIDEYVAQYIIERHERSRSLLPITHEILLYAKASFRMTRGCNNRIRKTHGIQLQLHRPVTLRYEGSQSLLPITYEILLYAKASFRMIRGRKYIIDCQLVWTFWQKNQIYFYYPKEFGIKFVYDLE